MVATTHPIPVGAPPWFERWALRDRQEWKRGVPQRPENLYASKEIPDASLYPYCIMFNLNTLKAIVSDGTNWNELY